MKINYYQVFECSTSFWYRWKRVVMKWADIPEQVGAAAPQVGHRYVSLNGNPYLVWKEYNGELGIQRMKLL